MSIREAADALGTHHKVIRRWIAQGRLQASKISGGHGPEWRIDRASLEALRQSGPSVSERTRKEPPTPRASYPSPSSDLSDDKAFLQKQVERLTTLLEHALACPTPAVSETSTPASPALVNVTAALQSALRTLDRESIEALQFCSVRVLWGRPVLWRTEARERADVDALLDAILSTDASWDPPGEEVVYLYAVSANGEALWGTACGSEWFGPAFVERLREARVERR